MATDQTIIPGIGRDKNSHGIEPYYSDRDDGLEYYGELLTNFAFTTPFVVSDRYPATHPITWFLKGCILAPVFLAWIILFVPTLAMMGLMMAIAGESWNNMKSR